LVGLTKLDDTINLTESIQKKHERTTRVWQKWRFSAPLTHLWLIKVWFSASTFVVKIATFAKPENVSGKPIGRLYNNLTDYKRWKNCRPFAKQKSCNLTHKPIQFAANFILHDTR
jgi:hypothetical protein